jgi:CspA family cold shock protein
VTTYLLAPMQARKKAHHCAFPGEANFVPDEERKICRRLPPIAQRKKRCQGGQGCNRGQRSAYGLGYQSQVLTVYGALRLLTPSLLAAPSVLPGVRAVLREGLKNMITGTVKFFNADKGYGFISPEDGSGDAFVHISAVEAAGMRTLDRDQKVQYELQSGRDGRASAVNLQSA